MQGQDLDSTSTANTRIRSLEVILGLLPLVLGMQLLIWIVYLPNALRGIADFRNCYSTGVLLRTGRGNQIFDYATQRNVQDTLISPTATGMPYVHPAYEALFFAPLSFLSYRNAFLVWMGFSLLLLLLSYWILRKRLWRLRELWRWLPILFFVGFAPVSGALLQGQDSLVTLFLLCLSLLALEARKERLAGFLVGLAFYKFPLVLPIVCLFLLWRRWQFFSGACMSAGFAIIASALVTGTRGLISYVAYVRETSVTFAALMPAARMPNLRGALSLLHLPASVAAVLLVGISLSLMALVAWYGRTATATWQFSLGICAATLVGYHVMMHDLSVMLIPMAVFINETAGRGIWSIALLWLASGLSFFGLGPVVAAPLLMLVLCYTLGFPTPNPSTACLNGAS